MTTDEMEQTECYYFGTWDQPGHYTFNRNRQGVRPSSTPGEVPSLLDANRLDQRFCRNPGGQYVGNEPEGLAYYHVVEIKGTNESADAPFVGSKWTIIAFNDRSGDSRPGSNSAFIARGEHSFNDMKNIARIQFPTVWKRMAESFDIVDIRTVR